jgi:hypothetical protein
MLIALGIIVWYIMGFNTYIFWHTRCDNFTKADLLFCLPLFVAGPINIFAGFMVYYFDDGMCPYYDEPGMLIRCRRIPKDAIPFEVGKGFEGYYYWKTDKINSRDDFSRVLFGE